MATAAVAAQVDVPWHRADVPLPNHRTEQGIGRFKMRGPAVQGFKSAEELLNGSTLALAAGGGAMPD